MNSSIVAIAAQRVAIRSIDIARHLSNIVFGGNVKVAQIPPGVKQRSAAGGWELWRGSQQMRRPSAMRRAFSLYYRSSPVPIQSAGTGPLPPVKTAKRKLRCGGARGLVSREAIERDVEVADHRYDQRQRVGGVVGDPADKDRNQRAAPDGGHDQSRSLAGHGAE